LSNFAQEAISLGFPKNLVEKSKSLVQLALDSRPVKAGSQVTTLSVPRSPSDVTREPKL
jgi:hypothetical protein